MGRIKVLKSKELVGSTIQDDIYPVTSTQAVYDTNNNRLSAILDGINTNLSTIINVLLTPEGGKPSGAKKVIVGRAISRKAKPGDIYFNSIGVFPLRKSSVETNDNLEDVIDENGEIKYIKLIDPNPLRGRLLFHFSKPEKSYPALFIVPENWKDLYYNLSKSEFSIGTAYYEELLGCIQSLDNIKLKDINYETTSPYIKVVEGKLKITKEIDISEALPRVLTDKYALFKQKKSRGKKLLRVKTSTGYTYTALKNRRWNRFYKTKTFANSEIKYNSFGLYKIHSLWRKRLSSNYATFTARVHYEKKTIDNVKRKIPTGIKLYNFKYIQ